MRSSALQSFYKLVECRFDGHSLQQPLFLFFALRDACTFQRTFKLPFPYKAALIQPVARQNQFFEAGNWIGMSTPKQLFTRVAHRIDKKAIELLQVLPVYISGSAALTDRRPGITDEFEQFLVSKKRGIQKLSAKQLKLHQLRFRGRFLKFRHGLQIIRFFGRSA